jgi:general secretion pathway protein D
LGDFNTREEASKAKSLLTQKIPENNSYIVGMKKGDRVEKTKPEEEVEPEEKGASERKVKADKNVESEERVVITPSVAKKVEASEADVTVERSEGEEISEGSDPKETRIDEAKPANALHKVALDFQDADIKEVITALAEIVGINYIIDPKVRGTVNIHTSGEIPVEGVLPILETIFEINNVAAVKVGDIYKIIPIKDAQKQFLLPQTGDQAEDIASSDRVMLQIVPLRYVSSQEMEKILKRFLGKGGDIVNYPERNILIIVDTAANMQKLLTLIDTIDLSIFETMHVRFYELEESEAEELAKELEELFTALGIESKPKKGGGGGEMVRFIPIERLNMILAVSSMPEVFGKVDEWIGKLDGVSDELEEQIFIYFVENAKAIDIGDILKELYGDKKSERDTRKTTRTTRTTRDRRTRTPVKKTASKTALSTTSGEIKVVVDEVNNAVIVRATPQDYAQVLKTIKLLDIIPKQVLVEVLIAEVTLDKNTEFGVEWTFAADYASLGGYKGVDRFGQNFNLGGLGLDLSQPVGASGFTYAFASEALEAFLRAYSRENEVKILSTPHILVADNTEATIDVGEEVPIVTSEYTPTTVQTNESFSRSIEYRDTGILLAVTPRINDKGLVTMEVNQEVSNVSEQRIEGIDSPIILKRQAETSLVVQDGRTIVIGGLIRDQKEVTEEGIPYLSKIPYLGNLFGYTKEIAKKTELLFLITPHVVQNLEEAELVTQEFKEKVKELIKIIGK